MHICPTDIPALAIRLVEDDRVEEAGAMLRKLSTIQATYLLVQLMNNCTAAQALTVGYFLKEFVDPNAKQQVGWLLRRAEFKMYRRLDMGVNIRRCLTRYLGLSPEGAAFVKALNFQD